MYNKTHVQIFTNKILFLYKNILIRVFAYRSNPSPPKKFKQHPKIKHNQNSGNRAESFKFQAQEAT